MLYNTYLEWYQIKLKMSVDKFRVPKLNVFLMNGTVSVYLLLGLLALLKLFSMVMHLYWVWGLKTETLGMVFSLLADPDGIMGLSLATGHG